MTAQEFMLSEFVYQIAAKEHASKEPFILIDYLRIL